MPEHEKFEELCALAAVGQITDGDLAVLQSHLPECPFCRQLQSEFVEMGALWLSPERDAESRPHDPRTALRQRVLRNLQGAGANFSTPVCNEISNTTARFPIFDLVRISGQRSTWAYAAVVMLIGVIGFSAGSYRRSSHSIEQAVTTVQTSPAPPHSAPLVPNDSKVAGSGQGEQELAISTALLRKKLAASEAARNSIQNELVALEKKVAALQDARNRDVAEMAQLRTAAEADQNNAQLAREQLRKLEDVQGARDADLVAAQYQVRDLETKLSQQSAAAERDRQMLVIASSSEMRDVIGARNLRIIDVADVDNRGARKPFGRVFYTEGKSLIFYAYDLANTKGTQAFYAWGQREDNPQTTHALGALINDDQTQRRWVFKCNDSKVLAQIDSVYVTLEPSNRPGDRPKGNKLLNAYLGMPANHP